MKIKTVVLLCSTVAVVLSLGFSFPMNIQDPPSNAADAKPVANAKTDFEPVDNMHHFMEYICEPSYKSLKTSLSEKPVKRSDWSPIKSAALILAETSSLVAARCPEKHEKKSAEWKKISVDVYKTAKDLYGSARRSKYDDAKKNYGLMIDACNKCHQVFDNGKHQLEK